MTKPIQPTSTPRNGAIALADYCAVRVTGTDAESFLQSQFASDFKAVAADGAALAAYCNLKGRVQVLARVTRDAEGFWLMMPAALGEDIATRLRRYVLRSKVSIDVASDVSVYAVADHEALRVESAAIAVGSRWRTSQALADSRRSDSGAVFDAATTSEISLVVADTTTDWASISASNSTSSAADQAAPEITANDWLVAEINAGIPDICAASSERFLPQMLDLDVLGGMSYTKGCYPGQEIVARARRGDVKRRLYRAVYHATPLANGSRVETEDGELAGEILRSATLDDVTKASVSLLVLRINLAEQALRVGDVSLSEAERAHP